MAEIKWMPGGNIFGTATQFTGIDYTHNGGINPDQNKSIKKTFQQLLLDQRVLSDTLLEFLQIKRETGYRQVFGQVQIPEHQGSLVVSFAGFKGGLANPKDFMMSYGQYNDVKNEQTFDAFTTECGIGYFGAYMKHQRHNIATSPYDLISTANMMLQQQAAVVLDNVAAQALFKGGSVAVSGTYTPDETNGQTITLVDTFTQQATTYGPLSWDLLSVVEEEFRNHTVELPKIKVDPQGTHSVEYVPVRLPISPQTDGNYTCLISREGVRQLINDPKFINTFVKSGFELASVWNQTYITTGSTVRGFRFIVIDNPVTVNFNQVKTLFPNDPILNQKTEIIPYLNFEGTGICHFATVIGGYNTADTCKETHFLNGIQWNTLGFESKAGDLYGNMMITGWAAFYGATVLDTSKVYNIIFNPKARALIKTGKIHRLPDELQRPHYDKVTKIRTRQAEVEEEIKSRKR